jgi:hypothetical protein
MNYLQSFLERILTQPRNMFLWLILLAVTARISQWRRADKLRRRLEFEEKEQTSERLQLEFQPSEAA